MQKTRTIGTAPIKREKPYQKIQRYSAGTAKVIVKKEERRVIPASLVKALAQRK